VEIFRLAHGSFGLLPRPARVRLIFIACLSILSSGLDFLAIVLLVPLLDFAGSGSNISARSPLITAILGDTTSPKRVVELTLLACACYVLKSLVAVSLTWWQSGILNRASTRISLTIMRAYSRLPWLTQQEITSGEVIRTVMTSVPQSVVQVNAGVLVLITNASALAMVSVALLLLDPLLALLALAYLGLIGVAYSLLVKNPLRRNGKAIQVELQSMSSRLIEIVGGIRETTIRGTTERYIGVYGESLVRALQAGRVIEVTTGSVRYLLESLLMVGVGIVVLVAFLNGSLEGGIIAIGLLLAAGFRAVPALSAVVSITSQIRSYRAAIDIVNGAMDWMFLDKQDDSVGAVDRKRFRGDVELKSVSFTFPTRDTPALNQVSLKVESGESIGIVGRSGSGKTTLVNMILGLFDPHVGEVLVDGIRLVECHSAWRNHVGYVPQDVFLLDATVAENVSLGIHFEPQALHDERLLAALSLAHLDHVIEALPEGIHTRIGEKGVQLSGGQRQRIGLARAFFVDPGVLVLDEATSALDNESESIIEAAVAELRGTRTIFVIAHRLRTVRNCDRIVFMDEGSVVAVGGFQELYDSVPSFAEFISHGLLASNET
jgi:ABC-type multidrug transport system fused ATPase/permease subunit